MPRSALAKSTSLFPGNFLSSQAHRGGLFGHGFAVSCGEQLNICAGKICSGRIWNWSRGPNKVLMASELGDLVTLQKGEFLLRDSGAMKQEED